MALVKVLVKAIAMAIETATERAVQKVDQILVQMAVQRAVQRGIAPIAPMAEVPTAMPSPVVRVAETLIAIPDLSKEIPEASKFRTAVSFHRCSFMDDPSF